MKSEFLSLLPDGIKSKVCDIERAIGSEIVVRRDRTDAYQDGNSEPPRAVCTCDDGSGRLNVEIILVAEAATHNLIHEVLHAHRAAVLSAPRLRRSDGSVTGLTSALTNDAEHLFIVPEEIALDSSALVFWEAEESRHFASLKGQLALAFSDEGELRAARHGLLRQWVFVNRVLKDWAQRAELENLLERHGWKDDADRLRAEVDAADNDACRILAAYLRAGHLPIGCFTIYSWKVSPTSVEDVKSPLR